MPESKLHKRPTQCIFCGNRNVKPGRVLWRMMLGKVHAEFAPSKAPFLPRQTVDQQRFFVLATTRQKNDARYRKAVLNLGYQTTRFKNSSRSRITAGFIR